MGFVDPDADTLTVALRKESVDRNKIIQIGKILNFPSLSARRAWIEIVVMLLLLTSLTSRSPQGERG